MSNSVASMNGISVIILRVSSAEHFENQNMPVRDFNHPEEKEEILLKMTTNKKQQKLITLINHNHTFCLFYNSNV